jgi:MoxR-like ATPase
MLRAREALLGLRDAIETLFKGKREAVELALVALIGEGHVLFEDVPGVGKTTLARTIARAVGASFKRVQFTSDLLPSDILGVSVFDRDANGFRFREGPIFANLVLADEINRTTPRTQSALLEAMNVGQVTIDDTTHGLPRPFMVMATQNPQEFAGTYPLPESQLDRFMLRVSIGYPAHEVERDIIRSRGFQDAAEAMTPAMEALELLEVIEHVKEVRVAEPVMAYLQTLVAATRASRYLALGVSTRGAIALYRATQARAFLDGREYALPDDVKMLFAATAGHRVILAGRIEDPVARRTEVDNVLGDILETAPVEL